MKARRMNFKKGRAKPGTDADSRIKALEDRCALLERLLAEAYPIPDALVPQLKNEAPLMHSLIAEDE